MGTESVKIRIAGTASAERTIGKSTQFRTGKKSIGIAADGTQNARCAFVTAQHLAVAYNMLCLLEDFFGRRRNQFCFKTLTHIRFLRDKISIRSRSLNFFIRQVKRI